LDWLDQPLGRFDSVESALRFLLLSIRGRADRREAS
jgi:hypothetical protein